MRKLAAALALVMMGGLPALAATPKKKKPAAEATTPEATPRKKVAVKKTNRTATTKPKVNPGDPVETPAEKAPAAK
jgi:hypothetical protein